MTIFARETAKRTMKRIAVAVLVALIVATTKAQPVLQVDASRQWVGELLFKTPTTITFKFTNAGDTPLLIHEVDTSCGCVEVSFPKDSIPAGAEGEISAVYDALMLGTFYRELAVYCNASDKPVYLCFEGRVVAELSDVDYETDFPIDLGSIRMNTNVVEFDDVNRGDLPVAELLVLNMKKEDFVPQVMHIPDYVTVEYLPKVIPGGRVGRVRMMLDSEKLMMNGLNQTSVYMSRYIGDKVGLENEILLSAVLLPSFADLSADELAMAPSIVFLDGEDILTSDVSLSISESRRKKRESVVSKTLLVRNDGETELNISALQVMNRAVSVSLGNRVVPAHGTTKLKVSVDLKELTKTKNSPRLLIISNDPHNAKTILGIEIDE